LGTQTLILLSLLAVSFGRLPKEKEFREKTEKAKSVKDPTATLEEANLFMALVEPTEPVKVVFPLSQKHEIEFMASREGLTRNLKRAKGMYDLRNLDHKQDLRAKHTANTEKTTQILLDAVKNGMTVQEARIGISIAQFRKLPQEEREVAEAAARVRMQEMPKGMREKVLDRMAHNNHEERVQLEQMHDDADKEAFVRRKYKPTVRPPKALE